MFVQIAVNVPTVSGVFDYHLPAELAGQVGPGCLVVVPFGRQLVQGVVVREVEEPQVQQTRPVESLLDPLPVLTPDQMVLAEQMAAQTLAPSGILPGSDASTRFIEAGRYAFSPQ